MPVGSPRPPKPTASAELLRSDAFTLEGRNGLGAIVKIFVTGATGVIGRRVVPALRARGHEITAAARSSSRLQALARPGVKTVVVDLFDTAAVRRAVAGHE